jgi:hypothetical protein
MRILCDWDSQESEGLGLPFMRTRGKPQSLKLGTVACHNLGSLTYIRDIRYVACSAKSGIERPIAEEGRSLGKLDKAQYEEARLLSLVSVGHSSVRFLSSLIILELGRLIYRTGIAQATAEERYSKHHRGSVR